MIRGLWLGGLWAFGVCQLARGQTAGGGPTFDPTPLALPTAAAGTPRDITPLDLLTLRDLHGVQISPDGRYVAFVAGQADLQSNGYRSGLFVVGTAPGSRPRCLGTAGPARWTFAGPWFGGEWETEAPQWSSDSRFIYLTAVRNGGRQVWRWAVAGGSARQITHVKQGINGFRIVGGRLILEVDEALGVDHTQLTEHGVRYDHSFVAGLPESFVTSLLQARPRTTATWIHDLARGVDRPATDLERRRYGPWQSDIGETLYTATATQSIEGHHMLDAKVAPDSQLVAYRLYVDDPIQSKRFSETLFIKPVRGGSPRRVSSSIARIEDYWWSEDGKHLFFSANLGDGHTRHLMEAALEGGPPKDLLHPDDFWSDYSVDRASRLAAAVRQSNTSPPAVALADLATGDLRTLVDLNPEFTSLRLRPGKRIEVTNRYGDTLHAQLVLPRQASPGHPLPLIITTYASGDFFLRGGEPGDEFPIQVFVALGFAVLDFNVGPPRNHMPGDFESAVLRWASPVDGMRVAIDSLARAGLIDPSRVGITGLSRGSETVEYAISQTNLFRAAASSALGAWDPTSAYLGSTAWWQGILHETGLGGWPNGPEARRWRLVSGELNADRVNAALLVHTADAEYLDCLPLVTAMEKLGKPVEMFIYADEGHILNQPKHRYEVYQRVVDWFRFWLQGAEDSDPAKREQYARWRGLRDHQQPQPGSETAGPKPGA